MPSKSLSVQTDVVYLVSWSVMVTLTVLEEKMNCVQVRALGLRGKEHLALLHDRYIKCDSNIESKWAEL